MSLRGKGKTLPSISDLPLVFYFPSLSCVEQAGDTKPGPLPRNSLGHPAGFIPKQELSDALLCIDNGRGRNPAGGWLIWIEMLIRGQSGRLWMRCQSLK